MDVYSAGDLSCTTVNAVNRLRAGLEELQAVGRGSSSGDSQARPLLRPGRTGCASGGSAETQLSRLVNVCKPSGLKKDADSFSRVSSISEMHLPPA